MGNLTSLPTTFGNRVSGDLGDEYAYSPLSGLVTIRLLRLMPHRNKEAPLQCQLFEYPLRKARQGVHMYEALSYVWGTEENQNRRLLITANLHAALSHLRDELLDRIMWIDAICINQGDNVEKGLQVQFMAEIYANANRVIVWLGEATSDSGRAFEALREAARTPYIPVSDEPTQQAIFTLLERPWEAAAARHILMRCGSDEVDGFALFSAQPIWNNDVVCLLQGASTPIIIRFPRGAAYSAVIRIAFPLEKTHPNRLAALRSTPTAPTDLVMIWDWEAPQPDHESLEGPDYEPFISTRGPSPQPWTEWQDYLVKATRSWSFGILINVIEDYGPAWSYFKEAVEAYTMALKTRHTSPGQGAGMADEEALREMNEMVSGEKDEDESFYSYSPLFRAVEQGRGGLVKFLLDRGATFDVGTDITRTPLLYASKKGHESIVRIILEKSAGATEDDKFYDLALRAAAQNGHDKVVQMLLDRDVDVNAEDRYYDDILQAAAFNDHDKVVQILLARATTRLDKGVDVNATGGNYGNVLRAASLGNHSRPVRIGWYEVVEGGKDGTRIG
ncbi:heterokaryon incompatibility protein-domain-containing protein [Chaetomium tenue]|uniref:Heterokaryon incompatibility protein-domain-containing protein n=1 Tax=Chaetomium tenue TaxID=1854479 RepID=A0ACB7P518_9PEZI|nr:heterokaryon incompatibility protein-domain-containing protein [Chaetomium globosum]